RILIVDDAVVMRRLLVNLLSRDETLDVMGTAPTGRVALTKVGQVRPDLVLLALDMEEMSGLDTLTALRAAQPGLPVIMLARAIGPSTGGPNALTAVLSALPANFPAPVVVVQHMPPMFTRLLADRLTSQTAVVVREAVAGALLEPGEVWLAPGDYHLVLERDGG